MSTKPNNRSDAALRERLGDCREGDQGAVVSFPCGYCGYEKKP